VPQIVELGVSWTSQKTYGCLGFREDFLFFFTSVRKFRFAAPDAFVATCFHREKLHMKSK
jgi:hypothetical protein